jgi:hypothetical protein
MTLTVAGIAIADPMAIWRDHGGRKKTLDRYDLAPAGEPDRSRMMKSAGPESWRPGSVKRSGRASSSGRRPRHGMMSRLAASWPRPILQSATALSTRLLYYHFAVPHERGIGRSKIHKVLHLKRPLASLGDLTATHYPVYPAKANKSTQWTSRIVTIRWSLQIRITDSARVCNGQFVAAGGPDPLFMAFSAHRATSFPRARAAALL